MMQALTMHFILVSLLLLLLPTSIYTQSVCPVNCACSNPSGPILLTVTCMSNGIPLEEINPAITTLIITDNQLTLYPNSFNTLVNLVTLDLSNNRISGIPSGTFSNLTSLRNLILDDNLIPYENFTADTLLGAFQITHLSLNRNQLISLPETGLFSSLTALTSLKLSGNLLKSHDYGSVLNLVGNTLRELDLSENVFTNLSANLFENLSVISQINLSNGQLTTLPYNIFTNNPGVEVLLSGNPWSCDCHLQWLIDEIPGNTFNFSDASVAYCNIPSNLNLTPLSNVIGTLTCTAPSILTQPSNNSVLTTQNIKLNCAIAGLPVPTVIWLFNNTLLIDSRNGPVDRISVAITGDLIINNIQLQDAGVYSCHIFNTEGTARSARVSLIVQEITCFDNTVSPHETDIDCGGEFCKKCSLNMKCVVDSDCNEGVCLYSHVITSGLLYISQNDPLAFTCKNAEVAENILQMRLMTSLFGSAGVKINTSLNLQTVTTQVQEALAAQLDIPASTLSELRLMTITRYFKPLIQVHFSLDNSFYGEIAREMLLRQVNNEIMRVTMKIEALQNLFKIRLNF